jgi:hypothetical protein
MTHRYPPHRPSRHQRPQASPTASWGRRRLWRHVFTVAGQRLAVVRSPLRSRPAHTCAAGAAPGPCWRPGAAEAIAGESPFRCRQQGRPVTTAPMPATSIHRAGPVVLRHRRHGPGPRRRGDEDQTHASGGNSGSGMDDKPSGPAPSRGRRRPAVSRADRPVRVKPRRPCGLTRPRPACCPGCRTTATGWARPATPLRAARPRPS